ncbi:MAG: VWA domain-containing protein [Chitinophagales bacterium]
MKHSTSKTTIHHLMILDESGSMQNIRTETITAFNELMSHNKNLVADHPDQAHFLSFFTFNGKGIRTVCFAQPLSETVLLHAENYKPDDNTPLYDALGSAILKMKHEIFGKPDTHVLVTVFTDGLENASREFSGKEIKQMVEELKAQGWAFTYLGTDHDVNATADSIAFGKGARSYWEKTNVSDAVNLMHHTRMVYSMKVHEDAGDFEELLLEAEKRKKKKDPENK